MYLNFHPGGKIASSGRIVLFYLKLRRNELLSILKMTPVSHVRIFYRLKHLTQFRQGLTLRLRRHAKWVTVSSAS